MRNVWVIIQLSFSFLYDVSISYKKKVSVWDILDVICWLTLFGSGYFTDFHYHLIAPSVYLLARGFGRRSAIKADLKNAVDYCRVGPGAIRIVLGFVLTMLVMTSSMLFEDYLPELGLNQQLYILIPMLFHLMIIYRFQNFTKGIRWYVSGIKLPGERSLLIPWRHISEIKAKDGHIHVEVFDKSYRFRINSKDYRSAIHFERWFKKKKAAESEISST